MGTARWEISPLRTHARWLASTTLLGSLLFAGTASAGGGMDPTPERLVLQPDNLPAGQTCQNIAMNPEIAVKAGLRPNDLACRPANLAFRNMISELGFAIAPNSFYPARSTGVGGFALTFGATYAKINSNGTSTENDKSGTQIKYWQLGTRGSVDPNKNQFSIINNSPDSVLQIYTINARKGLPLGFEIAASLGYIGNTTMWLAGGDINWSLLEGFRRGAPGVIPDVSIGGGVRSLTGNAKYLLTTAAFNVKISKPITLADSASLTPHIGYQRLFIFGDSNIVDSTPNVDALGQCGYQGADPVKGTPVCKNKLSTGADNNSDFNNNFTFEKVRIHRHRGMVGLNYRYEAIYLGSQFVFDLTNPADENPGITGDRQWTLSLEAGAHF
jgi:hypothetical protein